ncbi:protein phosphatase 1 regulatory subunit 37-like [Pezoporus occidentalis]|uniref:protein phosphatase 1 regulatory subunit 37-like n=1 Tax=Pezoporus occidentalis TaxID=407982 RepID=UPI002F907201
MALSLALKVNHSLLRLDLDREPKKEAVKSFIETQKALLGEIQNGCKHNFILAKEKEEQEQKLQQSASMAEIAPAEALEAAPAEPIPDGSPGSARDEGQEAENGDTEPAEGDEEQGNDRDEGTDSDTATDEDEDEAAAPSGRKELPDSSGGVLVSPAPSIPRDAPSGPGNAVDPAPCRGAERRISVSSPGRGHKVFVVTRVEPGPERDEDADPSGNTELQPCSNGAGAEAPAGAEALPNGLKVDFARALPEAASENDGKLGSWGAEHELSCSKNAQELEELLLEASQDTGQELP